VPGPGWQCCSGCRLLLLLPAVLMSLQLGQMGAVVLVLVLLVCQDHQFL
jgi:hypothetical protein